MNNTVSGRIVRYGANNKGIASQFWPSKRMKCRVGSAFGPNSDNGELILLTESKMDSAIDIRGLILHLQVKCRP